jgi:hypothetical protein
MALTILDAPLTISLEDLQTGIQNQEDAGFELVDLSKGTSAGVPVNLASFQPRTEKLQDIQLVPTPNGLFVQTGDGFSVDSAKSASFVKQMADNGQSVILYCPIVSIKGIDTSLAVVRQVAAPTPVAFDPVKSTSLSWDNVLARKAWSTQLIASVTDRIAQLEQANPNAFIDGYNTLSSALRIKFWAEMLIAIAKFESNWNPHDIFHEPPPLGVDSIGLLQLSYQDQANYKLEPLSEAARSLEDPLVNLRCGVTIFATLVGQDRTVASSVSGKFRGAARYWSTLRAGHKLDQIVALTKNNVGL